MNPLQFGDAERLLFGFHHPAVGASRRTGVLVCSSWGPEHMRSYRGVRAIAQRLAAAGFETLRFDYSGTGDSKGHSLDARFEHWLDDIALAAQELRDITGQDDIAIVGIRFGALMVEAARLRLKLRSRLNVFWDAPPSGAAFIQQMQQLAEGADGAKRWRRNRDMQLPEPEANELYGHAWPAPLGTAVAALAAPLVNEAALWCVSSDEAAPTQASPETVLTAADAGHWHDVKWVNTAWVPVAMANRLAEHLAKVLP